MLNRRFSSKISRVFAGGLGSISLIATYGHMRKHKTIIVFDIDHTLIHAHKNKELQTLNLTIFKKPDFSFELENDNNKTITKYDVWKRPYVDIVIPVLSIFATLHIFTSAKKEYADTILENMSINKYFEKRYYREEWKTTSSKSLTIFDGDSNNKLLVDDRSFNNSKNDEPESFYHISPFYFYNKNDKELLKFLGKWIFCL